MSVVGRTVRLGRWWEVKTPTPSRSVGYEPFGLRRPARSRRAARSWSSVETSVWSIDAKSRTSSTAERRKQIARPRCRACTRRQRARSGRWMVPDGARPTDHPSPKPLDLGCVVVDLQIDRKPSSNLPIHLPIHLPIQWPWTSWLRCSPSSWEGSRWSARSAARTNDLEADERRHTMGAGGGSFHAHVTRPRMLIYRVGHTATRRNNKVVRAHYERDPEVTKGFI